MRMLLLLAALTLSAHAQWAIQDAHTTADLRGIDNVGGGVAWASGTNGTVLRTEDAGFVWQLCATPPGAEKLDFRGIQAFDNNTAIVMSSGKGDLSRIYKTVNGCQSWDLLATNPKADGFWDALAMNTKSSGWLLGDPIGGKFILAWISGREVGGLDENKNLDSSANRVESGGRSAFAASNSALVLRPRHDRATEMRECRLPYVWFATSGPGGPEVFRRQRITPWCSDVVTMAWTGSSVPMAGYSSTSGVFSLALSSGNTLVAVGGDYMKPDETVGTAASTNDGGAHWTQATTLPHGYRSAVAYDAATKTWITVGPNGTDISTDDGRNWRPLRPLPGEAPDTDKHWNALSLPFVVGPKGRIGVLETAALKAK